MKAKRKALITALLCFCLCVSLCTVAPTKAMADEPIVKVLATTSYTPVALMDVSFITAATSTPGIYIVEYNWYDMTNGSKIYSQFGTGQAEVEITFATHDGYEFSDNVAVYLNNSPANFIVSADHHYLTLTRVYAPMIWAPSVIHNPKDEYVNEGDFASFVATANYVEGYQWHLVDPMSGQEYSPEDITGIFEITTSGDGASKLNLYNVTRALDGWQVYCTFVGVAGGWSNSSRATIHVRYTGPSYAELLEEERAEAETEELPEEPEEPADQEAPAEAEPEPAAEPEPEPETPEVHSHVFPETWSYDETYHWRECSCGERIEQGAHTMEWTIERKATKAGAGLEHGVCTVCGYESEREFDYAPDNTVLRFALIGIGGLVGLTLIVLIVDSIRANIRRRRRKQRSRAKH